MLECRPAGAAALRCSQSPGAPCPPPGERCLIRARLDRRPRRSSSPGERPVLAERSRCLGCAPPRRPAPWPCCARRPQAATQPRSRAPSPPPVWRRLAEPRVPPPDHPGKAWRPRRRRTAGEAPFPVHPAGRCRPTPHPPRAPTCAAARTELRGADARRRCQAPGLPPSSAPRAAAAPSPARGPARAAAGGRGPEGSAHLAALRAPRKFATWSTGLQLAADMNQTAGASNNVKCPPGKGHKVGDPTGAGRARGSRARDAGRSGGAGAGFGGTGGASRRSAEPRPPRTCPGCPGPVGCGPRAAGVPGTRGCLPRPPSL